MVISTFKAPQKKPQYSTYKYRWVILYVVVNITFVVGLEKCLQPIIDIAYEHLGTNVDQVSYWLSLNYVILISTLPFARALDRFGLKRMVRFSCLLTILGHTFLALSLSPSSSPISLPKKYRFATYIIGNALMSVVAATVVGFSAKVAATWFPVNELSRAYMIIGVGHSVSAGLSNHFVPLVITTTSDLYIISYIYLGTALVLFLTSLAIRRSTPPSPPSDMAIGSEGTKVSLVKSLRVVSNAHKPPLEL